MKAVAAILLLGLVIASVVCEPEEPEVETERKHRHKHSRGDDDYSNRNTGSYPRTCPTCPTCPTCVKTCSCQQSLAATPLSSANGCLNSAGGTNTCTAGDALSGTVATITGFCTGTGAVSFPSVCGSNVAVNRFCTDPANLGTGTVTVGACNGPVVGGESPKLCYEIKCPSAGFINIRGDAVPNTCCGASDYLYLFKSTVAGTNPTTTGNGLLGVANGVMNLDFSERCTATDTYWLCEKNGVIITSSIKATFTNQQAVTSCPSTFPTTVSCQA